MAATEVHLGVLITPGQTVQWKAWRKDAIGDIGWLVTLAGPEP